MLNWRKTRINLQLSRVANEFFKEKLTNHAPFRAYHIERDIEGKSKGHRGENVMLLQKGFGKAPKESIV